MFVLSLAFLVCQSVIVVVWVDVPNLTENAAATLRLQDADAGQIRQLLEEDVIDGRVSTLAGQGLVVIWPIVIAEAVFHWLTRPWTSGLLKQHFFSLLFCICPSLRMCARSPELRNRMWLPGLGWRYVNRRLRKRLERKFSFPMILIALLIMPVLIVEFFLKTQVSQYAWLRLALHVGTGVIWFAFAGEFIVMVSVAEKKLPYCKKNWIDLAIILLPLFSFLRSLRVFRAMGIAQALRLPQITKLARVYRLRGTTVKVLRALILLDVFYRLIGWDAEKRIERLEKKLVDLDKESKQIRREITRLRKQAEEANENG